MGNVTILVVSEFLFRVVQEELFPLPKNNPSPFIMNYLPGLKITQVPFDVEFGSGYGYWVNYKQARFLIVRVASIGKSLGLIGKVEKRKTSLAVITRYEPSDMLDTFPNFGFDAVIVDLNCKGSEGIRKEYFEIIK